MQHLKSIWKVRLYTTTLLLFIIGITSWWFGWPRQKVILVSETPTGTIKVREIWQRNEMPEWVMQYNPLYRFEFYPPNCDVFLSAQSYRGESYNASTVKVIWHNAISATVYLDTSPIFILANREWKIVK
jgi:hypothetical protein